MTEPWRIDVLGDLRARQGEITITRFRTHKTGALLAFLAFPPGRTHARDDLARQFWAEDEPEAGRTSLRQALSSLRRQLEPPGAPPESVLRADRLTVSLNPNAISVDVAEFEDQLRIASRPETTREAKVEALARAVGLYRGAFLPGYYEDWALSERERLEVSHLEALTKLTELLAQSGDWERATVYARRAVAADPLREESHQALMRLLVASGQPSAALLQYETLERLLREELDEKPSRETREMARRIREDGAAAAAASAAAAAIPRSGSGAPAAPAPRRPPPSPAVPIAAPPSTLPQQTLTPARTRHLPIQFTRFFGRDAELARVQELLRADDTRLLTLTGPGGSGKTRLATEAAECLTDVFSGGLWFVPLSDVTGAARIAGSLVEALGLPPSVEDAPFARAAKALESHGKRGPVLVVFDGFEHLVEQGAPVVHALMARVPALFCLVTSRQRLDLSGEQEYPIQPLPVPTGPGAPERLMEFSSVQLFADRARAAQPDFAITRANAEAVARLCERLEGMPLAIELAAAWAQVLTPAQMLDKLRARFELLASRRRDLSARHRSLRATIEWSYRLLPPELQRFFARLSVFRGGWTLEAAETVCEEPLALEYLQQLRERSLLGVEEAQAAMRYRLLETLREFAEEQVDAAERTALSQRHLDWCLALAERAQDMLRGSEQALWMDRLETEHDNLRAALTWCKTSECEADKGLWLAGALSRFWRVRGHFSEGRSHLADVLARSEMMDREEHSRHALLSPRAKVMASAATLALFQSDYEAARALFESSLTLAREAQDKTRISDALRSLGIIAREYGDYETAQSQFEESLVLAREMDDWEGVINCLRSLGLMAKDRGDYPAAQRLFEESLALAKQREDKRSIALALHNLGDVARGQEDFTAAHDLYEASLALHREVGNRLGIAAVLSSLGSVARDQGDLAQARALYEEGLRLERDAGDRKGIARSLGAFASVAAANQDPNRAARLLGAANALVEAIGGTLSPAERGDIDRTVAAVHTALGEASFSRAWEAGRAMSPDEAAAFALETT